MTGAPPKPTRAARRLEKQRRKDARHCVVYGAKADWIRSLPCLVSRLRPGPHQLVVAAHTISRGAGGTADHLVPLCWLCHQEQHTQGIATFEQSIGLPQGGLLLAAAALELHWRARVAAQASPGAPPTSGHPSGLNRS